MNDRDTERTPGPWRYEHFIAPDGESGPETRACIWGGDDPWALAKCEGWASDGHNAEANAAFIVEACNNYDRLRARETELVQQIRDDAICFGILAAQLDEWAQQSLAGGWSTHQVEANRKTADDCRRQAERARTLIEARG